MCKFLVCLPQFFQRLSRRISEASYVIEAVSLRSGYFAAVGHRIALSIRQPVLLGIRSRKD